MSDTSLTGRPAERIAVAVPPDATKVKPSLERFCASGTSPFLSETLSSAETKNEYQILLAYKFEKLYFPPLVENSTVTHSNFLR